MNYPTFLFLSKGPLHLIVRLFLILRRFGFTSRKIAKHLYNTLSITNAYGGKISFNITGKVLDRHPQLIKDLSKKGVEFGAHGFVHTNYCNLSLPKQIEDFTKAKDVFARHQIPICGFRAPYLCCNNDTLKAIEACGFLWSSNKVIDWNVLDKKAFSGTRWNTYQKVLRELYKPEMVDNYQSLPHMNSNFVEIPVSIPDDEILVDRLAIKDSALIEELWHKILKKSQERGELFTLQIHHERFNHFKQPLETLLKAASASGSMVWMASLQEIATWWKERSLFKVNITHQKGQQYRVTCECSPRATVLVKNPTGIITTRPFLNGYQIVTDRDFVIESPVKPCIGVSPNTSIQLQQFLQTEGFSTEENQHNDQYALYLDTTQDFSETNAREILKTIDHLSYPLIRYWRWPEENISAFSITGDIDSITLWDFFARVFEF